MKLTRPVLPAAPPRPPRSIDPNAPAEAGLLFGLDVPLDEARLVAVPVPYEATVSSRAGTEAGPRTLLDASGQVDLRDPLVGEPWRLGLAMLPESEEIAALSAGARARFEDALDGDEAAREAIDRAGAELWDWLSDVTGGLLDGGRIPLVVGGEHGVSFGALRAAAERHPGLGILHVDAHADLRPAYEGFRTSHASVMRRASELPGIARLVQVGLRDFCNDEVELHEADPARITWYTDAALAARSFEGEPFARVAREIIGALPETVWVSFDIDGLEPSLCPGTGTPVPGGLTWREATFLLAELGRSGRRVVGADLVEIGPEFWDGYVAAKLLYLLAGVAGGAR